MNKSLLANFTSSQRQRLMQAESREEVRALASIFGVSLSFEQAKSIFEGSREVKDDQFANLHNNVLCSVQSSKFEKT